MNLLKVLELQLYSSAHSDRLFGGDILAYSWLVNPLSNIPVCRVPLVVH